MNPQKVEMWGELKSTETQSPFFAALLSSFPFVLEALRSMSIVAQSFTKCFHCRARRKANLQMFVSMILIDCAGQVGGGAWRGANFTNA